MIGFYIHKHKNKILASTVIDDDVYTVPITDINEQDVQWTIGGSSFQKEIPYLRSILDIDEFSYSLNKIIEPPLSDLDPFIRANEFVGIKESKIPRYKLGRPFSKWIESKFTNAEILYSEMSDDDIDFAINVLNARRNLLDSMVPFEFDGVETKVIWNKFAQKTGRLSVKDGFNPLVLRKQERSKVQSLERGRKIVIIDFKALEFRIALKYFGIKDLENSEDPYSEIAKLCNIDCQERKEYKAAIIALLYGSSLRNSSLSEFDKIKLLEWFTKNMNVSNLVDKGLQESESNGYIRSLYGRRVYEDSEVTDRMIINNTFQSSGADFTFISYNNFVNDLKRYDIDASPLFMIHDSIIMDVAEKDLEFILSTQSINGYPVDVSMFVSI